MNGQVGSSTGSAPQMRFQHGSAPVLGDLFQAYLFASPVTQRDIAARRPHVSNHSTPSPSMDTR